MQETNSVQCALIPLVTNFTVLNCISSYLVTLCIRMRRHEKYVNVSYEAYMHIHLPYLYIHASLPVYVAMSLPALSLSGLRTPARISRLSAYRKDSACTVADPMLPLAPITNTTGLDMMAGFVS